MVKLRKVLESCEGFSLAIFDGTDEMFFQDFGLDDDFVVINGTRVHISHLEITTVKVEIQVEEQVLILVLDGSITLGELGLFPSEVESKPACDLSLSPVYDDGMAYCIAYDTPEGTELTSWGPYTRLEDAEQGLLGVTRDPLLKDTECFIVGLKPVRKN